jgi:hypothetical protein
VRYAISDHLGELLSTRSEVIENFLALEAIRKLSQQAEKVIGCPFRRSDRVQSGKLSGKE